MHYRIFSTADTYINSGSNLITGETFKDQNFGRDEILELKKVYVNNDFGYQTRVLINFQGPDFSEISQSIVNKTITSPKFKLRLFEANGTTDVSTNYSLGAYPISSSWDEGIGRTSDSPKTTTGCSWENRSYYAGASPVTWSHDDGLARHGVYFYTGSGYEASQSFTYASPDVDMDVTDIVNRWLEGSNNNGFLVKFSGSHEEAALSDGTITTGDLRFFSGQTNTIYAPVLEVQWDDHLPATGSNTGSLLPVTMSGLNDMIVTMKGLRESYRDTERVKFRVQARPRHIQKTFTTSVQTLTGSFIPEGSGSYSIVDVATNETVVPCSPYTSMSCDDTGNYFIQWMNGFYPNRKYKIQYKLNFDDNQEAIYDDGFEFIVRQ